MILKLVFEDLSFVWVMSWVRAFLFSKEKKKVYSKALNEPSLSLNLKLNNLST